VRRSFRKLALSITVTLLVGTAAACSSGSTSTNAASSGSDPELTNITVPALEIPDAITLTIAKDNGYFKAQGLNVTILPVAASDNLVPDLLSHKYGITSENYVGMYQEEAANPALGLKVIADDLQAAPNVFDLMVPKGSPITSVSQLKGKTIAFPGPGASIGSLSTDVLLNANHLPSNVLDPSDYKVDPIAFPDMPAALGEHKVDAAWVTEPFITILEASGARPLADVMTGPMQNFPVSCWAVTSYFAQKYPKTVAAFTRAIDEAQQTAAGNQSLVRKLLPSYIQGLTPSIANVMALGTFNTTVSLTRMERVAAVMEQYGQLPKNFDVKSMMYDPPSGS
jgi:NitT/TauT family transport system substrate-binding protein